MGTYAWHCRRRRSFHQQAIVTRFLPDRLERGSTRKLKRFDALQAFIISLLNVCGLKA
jgi:hypothetical protein